MSRARYMAMPSKSLLLIALLVGASAGAREVLVFGGSERPWQAWGTLRAIDLTSRPGWLQPERISPDENLSLRALAEGGNIDSPQPSVQGLADPQTGLGALIDGEIATIFPIEHSRQIGGRIILDLGRVFSGVYQISFYPRIEQGDRFLRGYELYVSDESDPLRGDPVWDLVARTTRNEREVVTVDIAPRYVRWAMLIFTSPLPWEIAELEVYGQGFAPRAVYTSNVIDLGGLATLGKLTWAAQTNTGGAVQVSTRSGSTADPYLYYRRRGATLEEVSKDQYDNLRENQRVKRPDLANWSPWSPLHATSGSRIRSPAPRRYFQFVVELVSDRFAAAAQVDSLAFGISSPPPAHEVVAEIEPEFVVAGETTLFTYHVRPRILDDDAGFDAVELSTPTLARLRELTIGGTPLEDFTWEATDSLLTVRFPNHPVVKDGVLVELKFDAKVIEFGTLFSSRVFASQSTELAQDVLPGDASIDLNTNHFAVELELDNTILGDLAIAPNPFTPNGDSLNDQIRIQYSIFKLVQPVSVEAAMYDLAGRRVRELFNGLQSSGFHAVEWDGREGQGLLSRTRVVHMSHKRRFGHGSQRKGRACGSGLLRGREGGHGHGARQQKSNFNCFVPHSEDARRLRRPLPPQALECAGW